MTISMDDLEQSCWECKGKGAILTPQGQTLLHFIKKHL
ncbi:hypothetical protein [Brevibacillus fortis]